jgi:hypothetical protein
MRAAGDGTIVFTGGGFADQRAHPQWAARYQAPWALETAPFGGL